MAGAAIGLWFWFGLGFELELEPELSGVGSADVGTPTAGRAGGVPCRERWKAFILASILSDRPPLGPGAGTPRTLDICAVGAFGLRALFNRPRCVEEAVIETLVGVEMERSAGSRKVLVLSSSDGLEGDSSGTSGDVVPGGLSSVASGTLEAFFGGAAIANAQQCYSRGMSRQFSRCDQCSAESLSGQDVRFASGRSWIEVSGRLGRTTRLPPRLGACHPTRAC